MSDMTTLLDRAADALHCQAAKRGAGHAIEWSRLSSDDKEAWRSEALAVARVILTEPANMNMELAVSETKGQLTYAMVYEIQARALLAELADLTERT